MGGSKTAMAGSFSGSMKMNSAGGRSSGRRRTLRCTLSRPTRSVDSDFEVSIISFPPPDYYGDRKSEATMIYVVLSLVLFPVVTAISCCFSKKVRQNCLTELEKALVPPSPPKFDSAPAPNLTHQPMQNVIQVWEIDAPTMEKFIQELAKEKPVRFTAQQLHIFTTNYSTPLGAGGFSTVYKGQFPNGMKIAVKVLKRSSDKQAEQQFMAEVGTIGKTYHRNLVRLYGFCYDQFMSALVFEYMENGSLDKYLFVKKQELEWGKLHDIAIGTAKGLAYLHEECQERIIHYDIKPANILLDSNFSPKVGDFGLAKLCNRDITHISLTGYRGTPGYSAPEFFLNNYPITHKCDVYSFGMVLFEIVGRKRNATVTPSGNLDWFPRHVWDKFKKGELEDMSCVCGIEEKDKESASRMCEVALWCVHDNPDERPPMSAVVKMLEGGVEIMPPRNPFQFSNPTPVGNIKLNFLQTNTSLDYLTSKEEIHSSWYKKATPIMKKYEIQIASS